MKIEAEIEVKGLKELKAELKATKNAMLEATDPKQMQELAQKAGELKDKIKDVNEQADIFATGSKYEAVTNAFGAIQGDLQNLDFEGASEKAKIFAAAAKQITFGDAVKSVKDLGTAFATLGKALLTNPLFLIAAVVAGVIYAIVSLMQKFGILQKIMDVIGQAFDGLIYYLQEIVLWFANLSTGAKIALAIIFPFVGIINLIASAWAKSAIEASRAEEARRKAREAEIKVATEALVSAQKQIDALQKVRVAITERYDHEIALAQAAGRDTAALEDAKLEKVRQNLIEELRLRKVASQQAKIILQSDFTKGFQEYFTKQEEITADALKKQEQQIEIFKAKQGKIARDAAKEKADAAAKELEEDRKRNQEFLDMEVEHQKELNQAKLDANAKFAQDNIAISTDESDRLLAEQEARNAQELANIEAIEEAKRQAFNVTANLMRSISDLLTAAGVENVGLQKAIALAQIAYDTGKAISGAIAQAQSVPFPANLGAIATGVTAVISGIASAIKAVQSAPAVKGAGGGGGSPSMPSVPNVQPAFNLYGNANQFNSTSQGRSEEMLVRAYVSETEITSTQNRLNNIRNLSQL